MSSRYLPRKLLIVGDSLSQAPYAHDAIGYVASLVVICPSGTEIVNYAIGGRSLVSMIDYARAAVRAIVRDDEIIALGTNDLVAGAPAIGMYGNLLTYFADAQAAGCRRQWCWTVPPSSGFTAPQQVERAAYNATLRTLQSGRVLDVDAILRDPAAPDQLSPRFLIQTEPADVFHFNTLAGQLVAALIASRLGLS